MNCPEVQELLAPYTLGALLDAERAEVESHLAGCSVCQGVLQEHQQVVDQFPYGVSLVDPPVGLRERILDRITESEQAVAPGKGWARRGHDWWSAFLRAARRPRPSVAFLALLVALATGGWAISLQLEMNRMEEDNGQLQEAVQEQRTALYWAVSPSTIVWELEGTEAAPDAWGTLLMKTGTDEAFLVVLGLDPSTPGWVYQAWLTQDGQSISAGTFFVNSRGQGIHTIHAPQPVPSYQVVGITNEPAGGSSAPSSTPVLGGSQ